jgi:hypothetical protein
VVRDDRTMNLDAVAEATHRFPDADVVLVESGGDNLTLTFTEHGRRLQSYDLNLWIDRLFEGAAYLPQ